MAPQPTAARSGLPLPGLYRIRDGAFNLMELHLNAQASQEDEAPLPSAVVSDASSLIEQVGRCLEAQERRRFVATTQCPPVSASAPSTRSPSPPASPKRNAPRARRGLGRRQPSPTASKSPPRKKAKRISIPPFMHSSPAQVTPDLSQYTPAVGGASQAKKRRSRTNRAKKAVRRDIWKAPNTSRPVHTKHLRDAEFEQVDLDWEDMPATRTGSNPLIPASARTCASARPLHLQDRSYFQIHRHYSVFYATEGRFSGSISITHPH
ncbi:hypothetical protein FB107DRAFT_280159 [Schizophyllum commune]